MVLIRSKYVLFTFMFLWSNSQFHVSIRLQCVLGVPVIVNGTKNHWREYGLINLQLNLNCLRMSPCVHNFSSVAKKLLTFLDTMCNMKHNLPCAILSEKHEKRSVRHTHYSYE